MSAPSILFLTKYDASGAGSRYRSMQYFAGLRERGFRIEQSHLFDAEYLAHRYRSGRGTVRDLARAAWRRVHALWRSRNFDLVFLEEELFPYLPLDLERLFLGRPFVVDYDDALFQQYSGHERWFVRKVLAGKIERVMRRSNLVIAGNEFLAERARQAGAPRVEIVPTAVDLGRYPKRPRAENAIFTIGWIGSPPTSKYLELIREPIERVCSGRRGRILLMGAATVRLPSVQVEMVPWSNETEVDWLTRLDVGIMQLADGPWERGKCGFKIIQYMAAGLPVVASPSGVNKNIIVDGVTGFLARTPAEWVQSLETLRADPGLRERMGRAGQERVRRHYCTDVTLPRLVSLLESVLRGQRSCVA